MDKGAERGGEGKRERARDSQRKTVRARVGETDGHRQRYRVKGKKDNSKH